MVEGFALAAALFQGIANVGSIWGAVRSRPDCVVTCQVCPEASVSHVVPPAVEIAVQSLSQSLSACQAGEGGRSVNLSLFWLGVLVGFLITILLGVAVAVGCSASRRVRGGRREQESEAEPPQAREASTEIVGPITPSQLQARRQGWRRGP